VSHLKSAGVIKWHAIQALVAIEKRGWKHVVEATRTVGHWWIAEKSIQRRAYDVFDCFVLEYGGAEELAEVRVDLGLA
jgi:hypothetical protein